MDSLENVIERAMRESGFSHTWKCGYFAMQGCTYVCTCGTDMARAVADAVIDYHYPYLEDAYQLADAISRSREYGGMQE